MLEKNELKGFVSELDSRNETSKEEAKELDLPKEVPRELAKEPSEEEISVESLDAQVQESPKKDCKEPEAPLPIKKVAKQPSVAEENVVHINKDRRLR